MYARNVEDKLLEALTDTPVVLLNGARQTGKSTLVTLLAEKLNATYATLDDATTLAAAVSDPLGFLKGMGQRVVIDEVQKSPALFPVIKVLVDADRRPGRFLLTGSANVRMLPKVSESLAGRMEIATLWPLSKGECLGRKEHFVDSIFASKLPSLVADVSHDLTSFVTTGGYPEAVQRADGKRRDAWFGAYITAILQRDVRDLAFISGITEMPRLLSLLAARVGGLMNMSELSRSTGIPHTTLKRYLSLLEATFLLQPLPAWHANPGKRLVKSAKIHLLDTGLTAYLSGVSRPRLTVDPTLFGHLLESFVAAELRKQATWSEMRVALYHYRTTTGREVDIVLENGFNGSLVGVEVKASSTVTKKDFSGLSALAEDAGARFVRGVLFYTGDQTISFGEKMTALPLTALWCV
ncbi:MAG: ATP-binding protein [Nitrospiria bacterium]